MSTRITITLKKKKLPSVKWYLKVGETRVGGCKVENISENGYFGCVVTQHIWVTFYRQCRKYPWKLIEFGLGGHGSLGPNQQTPKAVTSSLRISMDLLECIRKDNAAFMGNIVKSYRKSSKDKLKFMRDSNSENISRSSL